MRLFYGWTVVAAAFVILFTAYGAQYSFGVFFNPLLQEFHWSRASLSGVFSLYAFGYPLVHLVPRTMPPAATGWPSSRPA